MQIGHFFLSILSLVALEVISFASNLKNSMSIGANTYNDTAQIQVYSPTFSLFKKVSHQWMLGFKMRVDAITAASIANGSNVTHVDTVTGASKGENPFNDVRYAPTMLATYDDGENTLSFGGYYSTENDYEGRAVFANYVRELNEQNTALGIGFSQSFDKWVPIFKRALPTNKRWERKIDFSINQLITPRFSMQGVFSYLYSEGFLSSPYHYVLQDDIAKFENYPAKRTGQAYSLKGVYLLNNANAMNFSYRYYRDDWDISSHTLSVEELHDFTHRLTSGLRLRYYTQTKSNFVKQIGNYQPNDRYFVTDYRMSAFDSYMIGIPLIYKMGRKEKLTASVDFYQTTQNDYIKSWYGVDSISAIFTTLNYEFDF